MRDRAKWPIWRTDRAETSQIGFRDWLVAAAVALSVTTCAFIVCLGVDGLITQDEGFRRLVQDFSIGWYRVIFVLFLGYASLTVFLTCVIFRVMLAKGWGGWASAVCLGAALPMITQLGFLINTPSVLYPRISFLLFLLAISLGIIGSAAIWLVLWNRKPASQAA